MFHSGARVLAVADRVTCPVGDGKVISDYVNGLLDRVSLKLVVHGNDINWVVVNSEDFTSVSFDSGKLFEKDLLDRLHSSARLAELIVADTSLSPVERRVGLRHIDYFHSLKNVKEFGCVSSDSHESLSRMMKPNDPYYLEGGRAESCFVTYQLCWR